MTEKPYDYSHKVLIVGDSGVGKTCILLRFVDVTFNPDFVATIGIDFKIKMIEVDGKVVKLQIWDTAGQERFRFITNAYFRGAKGMALVYDVTSMTSFENVTRWLETIEKNTTGDVVIVLAANKCDSDDKRVVTKAMGERLAASKGIPFFETSAKSGVNINEVFETLSREIVTKYIQANSSQIKGEVDLADSKPHKHCTC
eukprot:Em0023g237a